VDYPNNVQFEAQGGGHPAWMGDLPSGLEFTYDGKLSGKPLQPHSGEIVVTATDSAGNTGVTQLSLGVDPPLQVSPVGRLPTAVAFDPYAADVMMAIEVKGGRKPYPEFDPSRQLPSGLKGIEGALRGTPTVAGQYQLAVNVLDADRRQISVQVPITIVTTRWFDLEPTSVKPLVDSLNKMTSGVDPRTLTSDVIRLTGRLKHEFPESAPLCLESDPLPESVQAKTSLVDLKRNLSKVRTPQNAKVIDELIGAITRRIHLLTANQQIYCKGVWTGRCVNKAHVEFNATLKPATAGSEWRWNVKESFPLDFRATAKVIGGEWMFDFGKESSMTGNFEYYPKNNEERFEGTLTTRAYGPLPFACSLKRVHQQGETPWD
jgi:hypothetical protein